MQEERQLQDSSRRSSYPTVSTATGAPQNAQEVRTDHSMTSSRAARTLPLPSPTWTSPTNTFPPSQSLPTWDLPGPSGLQQQQAPIMFFGNTSVDIRSQTLASNEPVTFIKKDPHPNPPLSFTEPEENIPVSMGVQLNPETERQRLRVEIGLLQAQVDDLQRQIDLFKQHAERKDAQYSQIVSQATKREIQGAADGEKWREERKQWDRERQILNETIEGLNARLSELHSNFSRTGIPSSSTAHLPITNPPLAEQTSFPVPPGPIIPSQQQQQQQNLLPVSAQGNRLSTFSRPRQVLPPLQLVSSSAAEETPLEQLQFESGQLAEYSGKLVEIGRNIRAQLDLMRGGDIGRGRRGDEGGAGTSSRSA